MPDTDPLSELTDPNRAVLNDPRVRGFLDNIGTSEGADYNTLVGGKKINDLSRHPNVVGLTTGAGPSTAFGKYQITGTTNRTKLAKYSHLDYSPENQDVRAVELLRRTGALDALLNDDRATAIKKAGAEWASLPGSTLPGRKNYAAFKEQDPLTELTKPQKVQPQVDPLTELTQQPSVAPQGRSAAMAQTVSSGMQGANRDKGWGAGPIGQGVTVSPLRRRTANVEGEAQPSEGTKATGFIRGMAEMAGLPTQLLPADAGDYINETVAKATPALMRGLSGAIKVAPRIASAGIPNPLVENMIAPTTQPVRRSLNEGADQLTQGVQAIDKEANRGVVSQEAQNLVAGSISSSPAMILTGLGVPAPVAFGAQSYLEAEGHDAAFKDIVKETAKGATIGALFELPLPAKQGILNEIGRRVTKAGIVGGGTELISRATGQSDPKGALINALFAASGGAEHPEVAEPTQTVPEAMQGRVRLGDITEQAKQAGATVLNPDEVIAGGKPKVRLREGVNETQTQPNIAPQPESAQPAEPTIASAPTSLASSEPAETAVRHVDLQQRYVNGDKAGNFKKETLAQAEARRAQVNPEQPNADVLPPIDFSGKSDVVTVEGKPMRPTVSMSRVEGGRWRIDGVKLHDDATGIAKQIPATRGDQAFPTEEEAHRYAVEQVRQMVGDKLPEAALAKQITAPASRVSEPQPIETKVKPKETIDALPVQGASGMDVRQQAEDGKALGEGNTVNQVPPKTETPSGSETSGTSNQKVGPKDSETKVSGLARGVEAKAIQSKLTQGFEGLPEYSTVKVADQAERAVNLLDSNPEQARRIAMGDEHPPAGLLPESVFTAVENRALHQGDIETIRDLATKSTRSMEATGMGQRIRMLAERNPDSPVAAIQQVEKARGAKISDQQLAQAASKVKTEVQVEIKKSAPKREAWASFLESIKC